MKYSNLVKISALIGTASMLTFSLQAFAQNRNASTSEARMMAREARQASTTAVHIQAAQNRGDNEISQRITRLNDLETRINSMKRVSDSDKTSLGSTIQSEISSLTSLQSKIGTDNSTTSVRSDVSSIAKSYRVYMLVMPQAQITAAGDRILTVVTSLNTILTKVDARLASSTSASSSTIQATLADFSAKVADANTQANTAISAVSGLKPDNGDTTIAASNKTTLQSARANIVAAEKDLQAARQDIKSVIQTIIGHK